MIRGEITGTELSITRWASDVHFGAVKAVTIADIAVTDCSSKQRIYDYQALVLFALAAQYNRKGSRLLEIGTYYGFSAAVLAQSCPLGQIDTLNPTPWEWDAARKNLAGFENVHLFCTYSWDYYRDYAGPDYDFVFVDGDHKQIRKDFSWWKRVKVGGLFLFHDFSPNGSGRPCPPAYRGLLDFADELGRGPDVSIIDDRHVGMVGWYKESIDDQLCNRQ